MRAGRDEDSLDPRSCEELFCAVIGLAVRDLERIEGLQGKRHRTPYESKKLHDLTDEWHPATFLKGVWFEEICLMLNVEPGTIRAAMRERRLL